MNSLVEFYSELLEEWDYAKNDLSPSEISFGSNEKVWWKCKRGHSWQATPNSRTYGKTGCFYCAGQKGLNNNSLVVKCNDLLEEWDYDRNTVDPEGLSYRSEEKAWWKCKKGHSWQAAPYFRFLKQSKCPYCLRKKG